MHSWEANLMDSEAVSALADRSIAAWGQLDLLVNNASAFYQHRWKRLPRNSGRNCLQVTLWHPCF